MRAGFVTPELLTRVTKVWSRKNTRPPRALLAVYKLLYDGAPEGMLCRDILAEVSVERTKVYGLLQQLAEVGLAEAVQPKLPDELPHLWEFWPKHRRKQWLQENDHVFFTRYKLANRTELLVKKLESTYRERRGMIPRHRSMVEGANERLLTIQLLAVEIKSLTVEKGDAD